MPEAGDHDRQLERFCTDEDARLLGVLTLYVGDRDVAEQLAQDALVRACQHWPRVRRMDHPRAWLTRVALNGATSWLRRRSAERRALARHGTGATTATDPDAALVLSVRKALARLPERQRRVVVLRYYAGFDVAETATALGCPEGTVKSLTHRARARLRDLLPSDREDDRVH